MSLLLYTDVHVRQEIAQELRRHDVDVLTAQQDGTTRLPDPACSRSDRAAHSRLTWNDPLAFPLALHQPHQFTPAGTPNR